MNKLSRNSESINEDIFESFMGALMLSNGFEVFSFDYKFIRNAN